MIGGGPKFPNSPLARIQGSTIHADAAKIHGWRRHNILVVAANDSRLSHVERELVKQLGEKLYGRNHHREVCHG
ncbi:MAG: hypothetical protein G8345_20345 [Magnetococcales bacterium]|nr:hypothetical protein [Magnetococcales bacterium]